MKIETKQVSVQTLRVGDLVAWTGNLDNIGTVIKVEKDKEISTCWWSAKFKGKIVSYSLEPNSWCLNVSKFHLVSQ